MKRLTPTVVAVGVLAASALLPLPSSAETKLRLRVTDYPPSVYRDERGRWVGAELEIAEAVAKQAGFSLTYVALPWERGLKWLEVGKVDLMFSLTPTPERARYIDFIGTSKFEQMVLVVRRQNLGLPIRSLEDLTTQGGKFGIEEGAYYPKLTDRLAADPGFRNHFHVTHDEILNAKMTERNRLLGYFEDRLYLAYMIRSHPEFEDLAIHPFILTEPIPVQLGASRKTDETIRKQLKAAYRTLATRGIVTSIMEKWSR